MFRLIFSLFMLLCLIISPQLNAQMSSPQLVTPLMQENFQALLHLQEYVADKEAFYDAKNEKRIRRLLERLKNVSHVIPSRMEMQDDLGLSILADLYSEYLAEIEGSFNNGYKTYARHKIRTATAFCMSCHTSLTADKSLSGMESRIASLKLSDLDKADFYSATRQFDKALKVYMQVITETVSSPEGIETLAKALRNALSITVRVQHDAAKTMQFLETVSRKVGLPVFFKEQVGRWVNDTKMWSLEKPFKADASGYSLMVKAEKLINHGLMVQSYPADRSADISFLRATSLLHTSLPKKLSPQYQAKIFFLLGVATEALDDPLLWQLDEYYYEACVRRLPHTTLAEKCFQRLSSKVYFGYSGSGGVFIPSDEAARLEQLRQLAEEKKRSPSSKQK